MSNNDLLPDLLLALNKVNDELLEEFRNLFFQALERHRLAECQQLLEQFATGAVPYLYWEYRYHQAVLYFEQRQYDQAEIILQELLTKDLPAALRAKVLLELAIQQDEQGRWFAAEQIYHSALQTYESISDQLGVAKTYNNLGICICFQLEQGYQKPGATRQERLAEAMHYHQKARELAQRADNLWEVAKNHRGLGVAYALAGRYQEALAEFETHLSLCQQLDDPCNRARGLSEMAVYALQPLGQLTAAITALNEAIPILRAYDDPLNVAEALTRRGKLLCLQQQVDQARQDYNAALAIAESIRVRLTAPTVQAGYRSTVEFIFTAPLSLYLQQGEAAPALSIAEQARARILADLLAGQLAQPHAEIPEALLAQRRTLHQQLDQAYGEDDAALDTLEAALAQVDRQIELLDPAYAGLHAAASLSVTQICAQLPANAALLAYVSDAEDQCWVLIATRHGVAAPVRIPNIRLSWLRDYLLDHLDGTRRGMLVPDPRTGYLAPTRLFADLQRALIEPLWPQVAAAQTLYIVPAGPLYHLPLGALLPPVDHSLVPNRRIVYAPSATILLDYCHKRPRCAARVLAIAPSDPHLHFIQGAAATIVQRDDSEALLGPAATRQALLDRAGHYRVVCFLGHAVFNADNPMLSHIRLHDGTLHASQMLRELRLQADLVILAACESGRGQVLRGDEMMGLSRALLYAGTPSLLVTLWPVHEVPTRLLVETILAQLYTPNAPFDPASALATAQTWLRTLTYAEVQTLMTAWHDATADQIEGALNNLWRMTHPETPPQPHGLLFSHPFFWSPYVVIGDQPLS
ncbi:MAG: CHAT domain-containing tetratricopeptide repeat protein [Caldilineaceae bacterium]